MRRRGLFTFRRSHKLATDEAKARQATREPVRCHGVRHRAEIRGGGLIVNKVRGLLSRPRMKGEAGPLLLANGSTVSLYPVVDLF